ncbi:MAG: hypothetical protein COA78_21585 [Blastopirellula sp.]|nr:MAG: hypothetical protein COA78_21585 [Blastopirellula sp.]
MTDVLRSLWRIRLQVIVLLAVVSGSFYSESLLTLQSAYGQEPRSCIEFEDICTSITPSCLDYEAELDNCGRLNRWVLGDSFTEQTGLFIEGWLAQGFTWNPDNPTDKYNGPVGQNDRANEYQLNQLYLIAGRAVDTECNSLSLGFQSDIIYGTDAFFFQSLGLDDQIVSDSSNRFYKLAIPQLYADIFVPIGTGVTFRIGKWYALVGYETGLATEDFFYSKSMGFNITAYSHTGVLASFNLSDQISTSHGLHRGSDVWEDNNNELGYTGGITWTSLDEATALTFAINLGPEQDERADWQDIDGNPGPDSPGENLNRVTYSLSLDRELTDRLSYALVHDYFYQQGSSTYGIENAEAYGVTQYLIYQHCDELAAGLRLEVYRDDDGFVGSGFRSGNAAAPGIYTNLSMGLQLRPCECLLFRPEIRWDWQDRDDPTATPAFNAGLSNNQLLLSVDAVMKF